MKNITSTQNGTIKELVKLHSAKGRKAAQQFFVEGKRAVSTFIKNGYTPLSLFVTEEHSDAFKALGFAQIITEVTKPVMQKMSAAKTPSGVLCTFAIPQNPDTTKLSSGLVLANISDPGNMGTLIRSCAAFGYKSVVVVEGCDPFCPKTLQASAGTLPLVNLFVWSWQELIKKKKELPLVALVIKNGKELESLQSKKVLFVVGNEAHGIKPEWIGQCQQCVTLPNSSHVESPNAAIAGTLALALNEFR